MSTTNTDFNLCHVMPFNIQESINKLIDLVCGHHILPHPKKTNYTTVDIIRQLYIV